MSSLSRFTMNVERCSQAISYISFFIFADIRFRIFCWKVIWISRDHSIADANDALLLVTLFRITTQIPALSESSDASPCKRANTKPEEAFFSTRKLVMKCSRWIQEILWNKNVFIVRINYLVLRIWKSILGKLVWKGTVVHIFR